MSERIFWEWEPSVGSPDGNCTISMRCDSCGEEASYTLRVTRVVPSYYATEYIRRRMRVKGWTHDLCPACASNCLEKEEEE